MSRKRYYIKCDDWNAYSIHERGVKDVIVFDLPKSDAEIICDLLNALHGETEKLKRSDYIVENITEIIKLRKENEELKHELSAIKQIIKDLMAFAMKKSKWEEEDE